MTRHLIDRYLHRMPDVDALRRTDPLYHARLGWLQAILTVAELAMDDENIPRDAQRRIISAVLYDGLNTGDAQRRQEETTLQLTALRNQPWPATLSPSAPPPTPTRS